MSKSTVSQVKSEKWQSRAIQWMPVMVAALTAVSLMSCTKHVSEPKIEKTVSEVQLDKREAEIEALRKSGKSAEADALAREVSDEWARMGELLMMPEGVVHADRMLDRALKLNSGNSKANFYKAQTGIAMVFKGYFSLAEGLFSHNHKAMKDFERGRREIEKLKLPEVSMFSFDLQQGDAPWTSYYQAQRFVREKLYPAVQASIALIDKIDTSKPLKLNFTPARLEPDPVRREYNYDSSYCYYTPQDGYTCNHYSYGGTYGTKKLPNEYFLDRHDILIYRSAMQSVLDTIRLATAYSFESSEHAVRRMRVIDAINKEQGMKGITTREVVETLKQHRNLLKLESDQELPQLAQSTSEVLRRALDFASMKAELCDSKERNETNAVVFPICIAAETVEDLQLSLDALAGPKEVTLGWDDADQKIKIVMDMSRALKNPVRDIKALLPTTFAADGSAVKWPDPTLGGLFPNGDFIEKIKKIAYTHRSVEQRLHDLGEALRDFSKYME
jgi:hypothetical protein